MSHLGQKRGFKRAPGMSAVPPIGAESLQERAARAGEGVGRWGDSDKMTQIVCTGPATGNDRRRREIMKIAFFGAGLMGAGFVRRALQNGHQVNVWNRDVSK